jgi:hypothetical protein
LSNINPTKNKETYTIYAGAGKGKFTMGKLKSSLFFIHMFKDNVVFHSGMNIGMP